MQNTFSQSRNDSKWFLKKIIFQNRYVALETPSKAILNFHFDYLNPSLRLSTSHLLSTPPKSLPGSGPIIHKPGSALKLNIIITIIKRGRETKTQLGQTWNLLNLLHQRFPIFSPLPEKSA